MCRSAFLLLMYFLIAVQITAQQAFTLNEAMGYAQEHHNDVKTALLDVSDASGNIREYLSIGLPQLNASANYQHYFDIPTTIIPKGSFFEGDTDLGIDPNPLQDLKVQFGFRNNLNAGIEFSTLLFDGAFFVGLKATRMFKEMVNQQVDITKSDLNVNVAKSYLAVLVAEKNQEVLQRNITNLEKLVSETKEIFETGFAEKLDVDRLELSLANLRVEYENVANLIELSENMLKFQMGYPMGQPITLAQDLDDLLLSEYDLETVKGMTVNYSDRPEYRVSQTTEMLNEINVKQLQMQYVPTIKGIASYSQILQNDNIREGAWFPTTLVGLALEVPIFDGFEKSAKIQRAKVGLEKHRIRMDNLERAIGLELLNAKVNFQNTLKRVQNTTENLELAERIYHTTQLKYREGVGSSLEVSTAERDVYSVQSDYIGVLYDLLIAKVDLDKAIGKL